MATSDTGPRVCFHMLRHHAHRPGLGAHTAPLPALQIMLAHARTYVSSPAHALRCSSSGAACGATAAAAGHAGGRLCTRQAVHTALRPAWRVISSRRSDTSAAGEHDQCRVRSSEGAANDVDTVDRSAGCCRPCRTRPRLACDRRGILVVACVLVFLAVVGLSTWALVESITGIDQVSSFWSIEEALVEQVRGAVCVQRLTAYGRHKGSHLVLEAH